MRNFEHNAIIVPRAHLNEWVDWALVVDKVDPDGTIHAFPRGGGFHMIINPTKVEQYDFITVPKEKLENPGWSLIPVYAEWTDKKYKVWSTGENWNGWAVPYFELNEALKYAKHTQTIRGASPTVYDKARDVFVTTLENEDEPQVEGPVTINVPGRGEIKVYPLGNGWTWSFVREKKGRG
jgi:hypothetical protein